jgi:hypothetical protein
VASSGAGSAAATGSARNAPTSTTPAPPSTVAPADKPALVVGNQGVGTFVLRSNQNGGAVQELPGTFGSSLHVRADKAGQGVVEGWGTVRLTGPIVQNGKVIADGLGQGRALDLTTASDVTNTIDNPVNGRNGWYARGGGTLVLPPIEVKDSPGTYTWGEEDRDATIDLVNSVRFTTRDVAMDGLVSISLLDPKSSTDAPPLPAGLRAAGLWKLFSTADFTGLDLLLRYDDAMARELRLSESDLGLWVFESGQWERLSGDSFGIDATRNLLWGTTEGRPYFFAALGEPGVAGSTTPMSLPATITPEPGALLLVATGAGALLMRHRKRA